MRYALREFNPCWAFQEVHVNALLDAAWKEAEKYRSATTRSMGWRVGPNSPPEVAMMIRMVACGLQDVENVHRGSSMRAKLDALNALWWILGVPYVVPPLWPKKVHKEAEEEESPAEKDPFAPWSQHPKVLKVLENKLGKNQDIWSALKTSPEKLFRVDRELSDPSTHLSFELCCSVADLDVQSIRKYALGIMSDERRTTKKSLNKGAATPGLRVCARTRRLSFSACYGGEGPITATTSAP